MEQQAYSFRPARILVVDNDPHGLRLLSALLENVAILAFAPGGEEALAYVQEKPVDLVLLSMELPGISGYAVCKALSANPETADIPVVLVTARANPHAEAHALTLGAADFIHKPINPPVLLARVKTQLALKQKTDALRRLTNLDALTGIANRRAFDETLTKEWRRALRSQTPLSLLMLDVDYFKCYNDAYGHPVGDACLRQVAQTLNSSAKRAGDLVARYGGEEFAVVLPNADAQKAQAFAAHVCTRLRELAIPHANSPGMPVVTLSIGAATLTARCASNATPTKFCLACPRLPTCDTGPFELLTLADQALYQAKHAGRNRVVCLSESPLLAPPPPHCEAPPLPQ